MEHTSSPDDDKAAYFVEPSSLAEEFLDMVDKPIPKVALQMASSTAEACPFLVATVLVEVVAAGCSMPANSWVI